MPYTEKNPLPYKQPPKGLIEQESRIRSLKKEPKPIEIGSEEEEKMEVVSLGEYEGMRDERIEKKSKEINKIGAELKESTPQDLFNFIKKAPEVMSKDPDLQEFPELKQYYFRLLGRALNRLGIDKTMDYIVRDINDLKKKHLPAEENFAAKEKIINYIEAINFVARKAKSTEKIQSFLKDLETQKESLYH
jgi:hypothetical protein